jgi:hypothetical protein
LSEYQNLVKCQGWVQLVELAKEQIDVRQAMVMAMEEKELGDFIELIRLRAEARAIRLFLGLPGTIIDQIKEDLGYEVEAAE